LFYPMIPAGSVRQNKAAEVEVKRGTNTLIRKSSIVSKCRWA
jgi:hypothetical protein